MLRYQRQLHQIIPLQRQFRHLGGNRPLHIEIGLLRGQQGILPLLQLGLGDDIAVDEIGDAGDLILRDRRPLRLHGFLLSECVDLMRQCLDFSD